MIADGKVVFTAPDAVSVHCLNLRDGLPVWTMRRHDNDLKCDTHGFLIGLVADYMNLVRHDLLLCLEGQFGPHGARLTRGQRRS